MTGVAEHVFHGRMCMVIPWMDNGNSCQCVALKFKEPRIQDDHMELILMKWVRLRSQYLMTVADDVLLHSAPRSLNGFGLFALRRHCTRRHTRRQRSSGRERHRSLEVLTNTLTRNVAIYRTVPLPFPFGSSSTVACD